MTELEYLKKYLEKEKLEEGIKQLESGVPVQYIVGNVDFYGNIIEVNPNVLIPRFETEELVDRTITYIKKYLGTHGKIVDLGTGSGCIAITLKKKLPDFSLTAVDISKEALEVAKRNAKNNDVAIQFLEGDMLEPLEETYDVVISNPPYIGEEEDIMDLVYDHEPHLALFAPNQGLYYYEKILTHVENYLNDSFLLAFEIGESQGEALLTLATSTFPQDSVWLEKDLQGRDRYLFVVRSEKSKKHFFSSSENY